MANLKMSSAGLSLLKSFEGCTLIAYWDVKGYSIGYGHFGVKKGETITQKEADTLLKTDLKIYEKAVNAYDSNYKFTQGEFDALVDFAYNLGTGNLDKLLLNGKANRESIKKRMPLYIHAGGKVCDGLIQRRAAELSLFVGETSDCYPAYTGYSNILNTILKEIGAPYGTVAQRTALANVNGISDYKGSYEQNVYLIRQAKAGTLRRV